MLRVRGWENPEADAEHVALLEPGRARYRQLAAQFNLDAACNPTTSSVLGTTDAESKAVDWNVVNPLSTAAESPWNQAYAAATLRREIMQDVERLELGRPDDDEQDQKLAAWLSHEDVHAALVNVLQVVAQLHPQLSYRQGLHEVLAVVFAVLRSSPDYDEQFLAHDAFALFEPIYARIAPWYDPNDKSLNSAVADIAGRRLRAALPAVATLLEQAHILPQVWLIRYLRLLLVRELGTVARILRVWDWLFLGERSMRGSGAGFCRLGAVIVAILDALFVENTSGTEALTRLMRPLPATVSLDAVLERASFLEALDQGALTGPQEQPIVRARAIALQLEERLAGRLDPLELDLIASLLSSLAVAQLTNATVPEAPPRLTAASFSTIPAPPPIWKQRLAGLFVAGNFADPPRQSSPPRSQGEYSQAASTLAASRPTIGTVCSERELECVTRPAPRRESD